MKQISYCTTCKGRLWQLRQTLTTNLTSLDDDSEIVLLNYHSTDELDDYIKDTFPSELDNGRLRYYKLITPVDGFDMAFAKHIAHTLGNARVLFNLDADNFIGDTAIELKNLDDVTLLIANKIEGTSTSRGGRIGITSKSYKRIGGYNPKVLGMIGDDGVFIKRALNMGLKLVYSNDKSIPIQQDELDKTKYIIERENGFKHPWSVVVEDHNGTEFTIHLWLQGTPI